MSCPSSTAPLDAGQRQLVESNLGLVRAIANGWRSRCRTSVEHADLVQVGSLALMEAARRFDPARGARFSVLAAERIRGAICDHFRALDPLTRDRRKAVRQLGQARADLRGSLGREPSADELQEALDWTEAAFHAASDDTTALAAGWATPHDGTAWARDAAASPDADSDPLRALLGKEDRDLLLAALAELPDRERTVLDLAYREELPLHEIGSVLGVTESRACQLRSRALARLREGITRRRGALALA